MSEPSKRFVIRTHAPMRRRLILGGALLLAVMGAYILYELGRFDAGYDRLAVAQERRQLEVTIERLEKTNQALRTRLAELETIRISRNRERSEVARTIGELQAQVAQQTQELAFYRGIVTQGPDAPELKIQQLRIVATEVPGRFRVRLTIVHMARPERSVSGAMVLQVEGDAAGEGGAASLDHEKLTGKGREQPFSFRYFESFDQEVVIPEGFRPERLTVEVRSSRKGMAPLRQSFLWRVDAA